MSGTVDVLPVERTEFLGNLKVYTDEASDQASHLGLLLIDISNLARINHNHGYAYGDRLLAVARDELLGVSKLPDTVFRISSHCFAFILPQLGNPAFIALAVNRISSLLRAELGVDAGMINVDLRMGVALNREGAHDYLAMLAMAEASLAHVKLGGDLKLEELLSEGRDELVNYRLEQLFTEALRDNDFELHYQPKVDLATGEVGSAEALLRWTTPDGELVAPELVVSMAESMGRSFELTKWVVHRAMRQLQAWQSSSDIGLALNVQAGLVGNPDLRSMLRDAIAIWGIQPGRVTIEITEDAIIEDKDAGFENLLSIRDSGIGLSIDDFGTGYSSLSYFKHIPAGELKIDKSFVQSLLQDEQVMELVKIMIHIAQQFGLLVVAEGIEDRRTMELLRDLGCNYGQGYFFTRPLPAEDFEAWLAQWAGSGGLASTPDDSESPAR